MSKAPFTYGQLDRKLRALGFTVHTQKGKARIYTHNQANARIILPDAAFEDEVLRHHLIVARQVLKDRNLGPLDDAPKSYCQYPPGPENFKILVDDLIRAYRKDHPDEAEDLEVFPPRWYGPSENGMLRIGRSIFVIRNNKVVEELREAEPPAYRP